MLKDIRHTGSFRAVSENGTEHMVHVFVEILDASSHDDPDGELEGLKTLPTADGHFVNRLEKGRYQIVETGEILLSSDENAP